ncbi:hypothetical protein C2G38_2157636 [Gigaspora rosea]|uniref:Uncharacterized protein n=1 Tax=Gigaspora rosea TaxID=44941 RepID=A0A397W4R7_9GLOM|nr:hypothetical protein C2G38_2157636 [Gigaspora rosea]
MTPKRQHQSDDTKATTPKRQQHQSDDNTKKLMTLVIYTNDEKVPFFRGFLALGLGFRVRVINKRVYVGFISFKAEKVVKYTNDT